MTSPPELPAHIIEIMEPNAITLVAELARHGDRAVPYAVISAPGAAVALGGPWWHALTADMTTPHILDCGQAAGIAAWALRHGQLYVACDAAPAQMRALHALATCCGGHVMSKRPDAFALGMPPYTDYRRRCLSAYLVTPTP